MLKIGQGIPAQLENFCLSVRNRDGLEVAHDQGNSSGDFGNLRLI